MAESNCFRCNTDDEEVGSSPANVTMAVPSQPAALLASEQEPEPELEPELEPRESHDAIVEKLQHTRSQFMDRRWMCEYETAMQNSSTQWIHGWDALDGTGELEPGAHGGGYRNTFSGIKGGWTQ